MDVFFFKMIVVVVIDIVFIFREMDFFIIFFEIIKIIVILQLIEIVVIVIEVGGIYVIFGKFVIFFGIFVMFEKFDVIIVIVSVVIYGIFSFGLFRVYVEEEMKNGIFNVVEVFIRRIDGFIGNVSVIVKIFGERFVQKELSIFFFRDVYGIFNLTWVIEEEDFEE